MDNQKQKEQEKNIGNQPNRGQEQQHNPPGHQQGQFPNREKQNQGTQNPGDKQKEQEYSKR